MGVSENAVESTTPFCLPDLSGEFYARVLQRLHHDLQPKSYLEIGTLSGDTLKLASCPSIAIDPRFRIENQDVVGEKRVCSLYQMTSDDFFAAYDPRSILGGPIDL